VSLLRLYVPLTLRKVTGRDTYGQGTLGDPIAEKCMVVKNKHTDRHTTVRADSSASRGYADEYTTENRFLVAVNTQIEHDDQIAIAGLLIKVKVRHPRYDVFGKLDHYEIEGEPWG
jgi:hypothetical protein